MEAFQETIYSSKSLLSSHASGSREPRWAVARGTYSLSTLIEYEYTWFKKHSEELRRFGGRLSAYWCGISACAPRRCKTCARNCHTAWIRKRYSFGRVRESGSIIEWSTPKAPTKPSTRKPTRKCFFRLYYNISSIPNLGSSNTSRATLRCTRKRRRHVQSAGHQDPHHRQL
jgi:hypothetical protein